MTTGSIGLVVSICIDGVQRSRVRKKIHMTCAFGVSLPIVYSIIIMQNCSAHAGELSITLVGSKSISGVLPSPFGVASLDLPLNQPPRSHSPGTYKQDSRTPLSVIPKSKVLSR